MALVEAVKERVGVCRVVPGDEAVEVRDGYPDDPAGDEDPVDLP